MNEFCQMLKKDHKAVKEILGRQEATEDKSKEREGLFQKLRKELVPHMKAEEIAYYNPTSSVVTVELGEPFYSVELSGGHSVKQGGDGAVRFEGPQSTIALPPKRGALVLKQPALGR